VTDYQTGHVKHDPDSGAVAIRTVLPEDNPQLAGRAWLIATAGSGVRTGPTTEVDEWDDLFTPAEPPPT
jgi:hypothetical protein